MKNKLSLLVVMLIAVYFTAEAQSKSQMLGYKGVEFGTIVSKHQGNKKIITYFEDYGRKFREERYDKNNKMVQITVCDGRFLRNVMTDNPQAIEEVGEILNKYFGLYTEDAIKRQDKKYKKLNPKTIAGKQCEHYKYTNMIMNKEFTVYSWNGILMEQAIGGEFFMQVTSIDTSKKPNVDYSL